MITLRIGVLGKKTTDVTCLLMTFHEEVCDKRRKKKISPLSIFRFLTGLYNKKQIKREKAALLFSINFT